MKKNQIINSDYSYNILTNILKEYGVIQDGFYIIDEIIYKRMVYDEKMSEFLQELKSCYYDSKLRYLENCNTYNNFLTIIRHICSYNNITYIKKIFYIRSKYIPSYYINMNSINI